MDIYISENIRLLRNKYGYTLEGLAEIINVSRQTVAKWENRESLPDIVNCVRLSALFKVSLDELVVMPMENILSKQDDNQNSQKIMGILSISDNREITLPSSVLDMFDLKTGEKILLLADKYQGIALVKCSQLDE